jgi:hypothetical protein
VAATVEVIRMVNGLPPDWHGAEIPRNPLTPPTCRGPIFVGRITVAYGLFDARAVSDRNLARANVGGSPRLRSRADVDRRALTGFSGLIHGSPREPLVDQRQSIDRRHLKLLVSASYLAGCVFPQPFHI